MGAYNYPYINPLLQKHHVNALELGAERWVHQDGVEFALHHLVGSPISNNFSAIDNGRCWRGGQVRQDKVHLNLEFLAVLLSNGNSIRIDIKSDVVPRCGRRNWSIIPVLSDLEREKCRFLHLR